MRISSLSWFSTIDKKLTKFIGTIHLGEAQTESEQAAVFVQRMGTVWWNEE